MVRVAMLSGRDSPALRKRVDDLASAALATKGAKMVSELADQLPAALAILTCMSAKKNQGPPLAPTERAELLRKVSSGCNALDNWFAFFQPTTKEGMLG